MENTNAGELATTSFDCGFNCCESVLRALNDAHGLGLPPAACGVATPFGGGLAGAKESCGALVGGMMALGLARGRQNSDQPAGPATTAGRDLVDQFREEFHAIRCEELTSAFVWDQPERRASCRKKVQFVADAVTSILTGAES